MHIAGDDGIALTLTAVRWQLPPDAGEGDDAWLVIGGEVESGRGEWSFADPCLEMAEARELATWLRDAGEGRIPCAADGETEPTLRFLEPALGFSVHEHDKSEVALRVFLTAEGAPPWLRRDNPHRAREVVDLPIRRDQLLAAADDWSQELDALPARPWLDTGA